MNQQDKTKIVSQINAQTSKTGWSASKVANLAGVAKGTISAMVNNKWSSISDEMWEKVSKALDFNPKQWNIAQTKDFRRLTATFKKAQKNSLAIGVSYHPGSGKSAAGKTYANENDFAYYLNCAEHFTKRLFLLKLSKAMGMDVEGLRTLEIIERIIDELNAKSSPLVIFDEIDKLNDRTLMFFIEFYNRLEDKCGFVLMGAPYLKERVEKGVRKDKMGFREIYSRIGRKFLHLDGCDQEDIKMICNENGITDGDHVREVINAYRENQDLRRVRREIDRLKIKSAAAA